MALRFLLAFLCIASTKTLPLDEIEVLKMFHRKIKSSRPMLPRFADIGKEGPDVRLSGHSKSSRSNEEIAEVCLAGSFVFYRNCFRLISINVLLISFQDNRIRQARRLGQSEQDGDDNHESS